jgi:mRNA interferase RelE/StbE
LSVKPQYFTLIALKKSSSPKEFISNVFSMAGILFLTIFLTCSMFEIFLTHRAEKALKSLDVKIKRRIETALDDLAYTYFPKKYDIKKLKGVKSTYRIRIMNYRIIYALRS